MGSVVMNGPYHGRSLSGVEQGAIATSISTTSTSSSATAAAIAARLSAAKFVLAVSEHGAPAGNTPVARPGGADASGRRLVLSNKLAISDMSTMTMASLRERLIVYARIPLYSSNHVFCTSTGTEVTDESMSVANYLQLEARTVERKAGLPAVSVYYKTHCPDVKPQLEAKQASVRFA